MQIICVQITAKFLTLYKFFIQDVGKTAFEVCLKDLPGINGQHEPITVDYAAVGGI